MMAMSARAVSRIAGVRLLVAALWAGALWVLGYVAAPAVFSTAS